MTKIPIRYLIPCYFAGLALSVSAFPSLGAAAEAAQSTNLATSTRVGVVASAPDFAREPDAVIATKKLFDLPRDIISIPILKDLLTEDFVFYYRDGGADWLSFRGALARIAYEKKTDWPMRLMKWIMNGPAEIALWKGVDGKLNHFSLVIDQTGVKDLFKIVAQSAASDSQLSAKNVGGREILALKLPNEREVFFSSDENRLFIFSDESMPLPNAALAREWISKVKAFFGANEEIAVYAPSLKSSQHAVTLSARYLSFGYQAFFESLQAIRFQFSAANGWDTQVLTKQNLKPVDAKDWAQMPRGAAFCAALPVETKAIGSIVKAPSWLGKIAGAAVACWYPESKFYTPLIAVRGEFGSLLKSPSELQTSFESLVGAKEAIWQRPALPESEGAAPLATVKWLDRLPVKTVAAASGQIGFTREVGARFGIYPVAKSSEPKKLGSYRFFRVKMVATGNSIYFSPDDQLVDRALLTAGGKFPSLASSASSLASSLETTKGGPVASVFLAPDAFAKLAKQMVLDTLPAAQESEFRTAVSRHLFPNLEKFGQRPLQAASIAPGAAPSTDGGGWKKVDWTTHAGR